MIRKISHIAMSLSALLFTLGLGSCQEYESYNDLLQKEEKAVNWYLAGEEIELDIPENDNFEVGENAPFYRMKDDGSVYMKVLKKGTQPKPEKGDAVYFRYSFKNIEDMWSGLNPAWSGNSIDLNGSIGARYFIFEEMQYKDTYEYGYGIQLPMKYLGLDSEVMLVVKSTQGFYGNQAKCVPVLYRVRYFAPQY